MQLFTIPKLKGSLLTTIWQKMTVRNVATFLIAFGLRTIAREIVLRWWTHISHRWRRERWSGRPLSLQAQGRDSRSQGRWLYAEQFSGAARTVYLAVRLPQGSDNRVFLPAFEFLAHEKKGLRRK